MPSAECMGLYRGGLEDRRKELETRRQGARRPRGARESAGARSYRPRRGNGVCCEKIAKAGAGNRGVGRRCTGSLFLLAGLRGQRRSLLKNSAQVHDFNLVYGVLLPSVQRSPLFPCCPHAIAASQPYLGLPPGSDWILSGCVCGCDHSDVTGL